MGDGGKKVPPGFTNDMLEPLILPKHQTHFKIFNYAVTIGKKMLRNQLSFTSIFTWL